MQPTLDDLQTLTKAISDLDSLKKVHDERLAQSHDARYERYQKGLALAQKLAQSLGEELPTTYSIKDHVVRIGEKITLTKGQKDQLILSLEQMIPWRKGPFELFGQKLDAEWQSDLKWERVRKVAGSLQGKAILDIGCNNGYYLYLMAKQNPKFVLGIDPTIPYHFQFELLKTFCAPPKTLFTLHGFENLSAFNKTFDVIFCMGIVYHHTDPIGLLKTIFQTLRPGGLLILESMGIPGDGPYCLLPKSRYLGMPGHWFIPTREALEHLLTRAGFQYVKTFLTVPMSADEQRQTPWAPYESFTDGLDPKNPSLTKEGYPAPQRFFVTARRVRKGRF